MNRRHVKLVESWSTSHKPVDPGEGLRVISAVPAQAMASGMGLASTRLAHHVTGVLSCCPVDAALDSGRNFIVVTVPASSLFVWTSFNGMSPYWHALG